MGESSEFIGFLSGVASRLRHDLKGGLITLRMGLEALPDEEELKPLLVERTQQLEGLADKLVLLLRMGEMKLEGTRLPALLGEFRRRAADLFPELQVALPEDVGADRSLLDADAVLYALTEIAENARLAGGNSLRISALISEGVVELTLDDDGTGLLDTDLIDPLAALTPLGASRWGRSGLGLAIIERCAMGHGGHLTMLPNSDGKGTRVVLRLSPQ